jgi:hypothetical protein
MTNKILSQLWPIRPWHLFVMGIVCVLGASLFPGSQAGWLWSGAALLDVAYLLVVWRIYRRKEPVWTRGGKIEASDPSYVLPFLFLFILGLVALCGLVVASIV